MPEDEKKPVGRPPGRHYAHKLFSYLCDERHRKAQELARRRGCSMAALLRALIDEEAERRGVE